MNLTRASTREELDCLDMLLALMLLFTLTLLATFLLLNALDVEFLGGWRASDSFVTSDADYTTNCNFSISSIKGLGSSWWF